jgi:hypothetical protein
MVDTMTGKKLYEMHIRAMASVGIDKLAWHELNKATQQAWIQLATEVRSYYNGRKV